MTVILRSEATKDLLHTASGSREQIPRFARDDMKTVHQSAAAFHLLEQIEIAQVSGSADGAFIGDEVVLAENRDGE